MHGVCSATGSLWCVVGPTMSSKRTGDWHSRVPEAGNLKIRVFGALGLLFRSWSPIVGCQAFYMPMYFFYVNSPQMSGKGLEDGGSTFNKHFALFKFVRQSSGCDEVIGCFVNTVPVRVTLMDSAGDRSFQSILGSAGRGKWEVKKQTGPSCCG